MTAELEATLLGTTLTSSIPTHQRLKDLSQTFGCSEDIVSRFAMSLSMKAGPVPQQWEAKPISEGLTVLNGKSIRGKTLFKSELALFLVMLAIAEPEAEPHHVRELFKLHWERGVEMMGDDMGDLDWLEYLADKLGRFTSILVQ
jgi:DNA sulfur modification protein DndE